MNAAGGYLKRATIVLATLLLITLAPRVAQMPAVQAQDQPVAIPTTGAAVPSMAGLDAMMSSLMQKWQIPGGALAIAKDGRLVFARGYGNADSNGTPVQPDSLFRIASVSKVFTSTAILTLVDQGLLSLDTPALGLLNIQPPAGAAEDPRIATITVRELLQHTGGWDRDVTPDPLYRPFEVAAAMGVPPPPDCPTTIAYVLGQPLDFDPGTRYAYANIGYCILGRVVEAASGMTYGDYVKQYVMTPAGITRMALGRTLQSDALPGEVTYFPYPGQPLATSVFDGSQVPWPYGGFAVETRDSTGGWVGSAVDLLKLTTALGGRRGPGLLQPATFAAMLARPAPPVAVGTPTYDGLGWSVRPANGGFNFWKDGDFPGGTFAYVVRLANGWEWAAVFNSRPQDVNTFESELGAAGNQAVNKVTQAPSGDQFPQFP